MCAGLRPVELAGTKWPLTEPHAPMWPKASAIPSMVHARAAGDAASRPHSASLHDTTTQAAITLIGRGRSDTVHDLVPDTTLY